jgi:hypothetical protein
VYGETPADQRSFLGPAPSPLVVGDIGLPSCSFLVRLPGAVEKVGSEHRKINHFLDVFLSLSLYTRFGASAPDVV